MLVAFYRPHRKPHQVGISPVLIAGPQFACIRARSAVQGGPGMMPPMQLPSPALPEHMLRGPLAAPQQQLRPLQHPPRSRRRWRCPRNPWAAPRNTPTAHRQPRVQGRYRKQLAAALDLLYTTMVTAERLRLAFMKPQRRRAADRTRWQRHACRLRTHGTAAGTAATCLPLAAAACRGCSLRPPLLAQFVRLAQPTRRASRCRPSKVCNLAPHLHA